MTRGIIHLAAGGTGGHIFPALSVAEILQARGFTPYLFTDKRGSALLAGMDDLPVSLHVISAASPYNSNPVKRLGAVIKLAFGALTCVLKIGITRPEVMIGFGGYPSFAPLMVARLLGVPTMVHEQNAFLGRANKYIASGARLLALSWPQTKNLPPKIIKHVTGIPVRTAFFVGRNQQNTGKTLTLTILGGSQGAIILGSLVPDAIAMLDKALLSRVQIYQQARVEQVDALTARYKALGVPAIIETFFNDMPDLLAKSDLVICRSGASSIAELAAIGRAALMLPLPSAMDDHQRANALQMEATGGGYCLDETSVSPAFLATRIIQLFENPEHLQAMGRKATHLASPNAASDIADLAESLIHKPKSSSVGAAA